uniref:Uncharacterized protein n=1 Tax=Anguilla anguilla TaxID=7936 RepID=A0A0E9QBQ2_ANGAN
MYSTISNVYFKSYTTPATQNQTFCTHIHIVFIRKTFFMKYHAKTSNHYKNNNNSCSMLLIHIKIFAIIIIITEKHSLLTPSLCQNSCLSGNS